MKSKTLELFPIWIIFLWTVVAFLSLFQVMKRNTPWLAGTSLSELFVINSFITQPDAFNAYIAASPSLWWDNLESSYQEPQN